MRLSIIIPAYKVAAYIERCIRSLEDQDLPKSDYEIIVTNDGSPDDCQTIVEKLQNEFSNIVLINQENQGVSMARNNGMALAKGHYILPIDPDDYVLPNTFNQLLLRAEEKKLDVLYLGFEIFDTGGKSIWKTDYQMQEAQVYTGVEGYFASRGLEVKDPDRSWAILYKKELLDNYAINYPKNVPYLEDGLFVAKVFAVAQKVGFCNNHFYQRTTRMGSATNSKLFYSERAIEGFILAIDNIKKFAKQSNLSQSQNELINHTIAKFVLLAITPSISKFNFIEYFNILKKLEKANINKIDSQGLRFLYKKHMQMFNFSKLLFPIYFKLLNK